MVAGRLGEGRRKAREQGRENTLCGAVLVGRAAIINLLECTTGGVHTDVNHRCG